MRYYRTHLRGTRHGGVTPTIDYERTREDLADGQPLRSYPVSDFAGLAQAMGEGPVHVLDTRRADERAQGCAAPSTSRCTNWLPASTKSPGHGVGVLRFRLPLLHRRLRPGPPRPNWGTVSQCR